MHIFEEMERSITHFEQVRKTLIQYAGLDAAERVLFRYGWNLGIKHAREFAKPVRTVEQVLLQSAQLHSRLGYIRGLKPVEQERRLATESLGEHNIAVRRDSFSNIISLRAQAVWVDSIEARHHLQHFGFADRPVCASNAGYSSAFASYICNKPVYVKEISCIAKGDPECVSEMRLAEEWDEVPEELKDFKKYELGKMHTEVDLTVILEMCLKMHHTEQLRSHLMQGVMEGWTLERIVRTAARETGAAISVEDTWWRTLASSDHALFEEETQSNETLKLVRLQQKAFPDQRIFRVSTGRQLRLVMPVNYRNQTMAFCSMIVPPSRFHQTESFMKDMESIGEALSLFFYKEQLSTRSLDDQKSFVLYQMVKGNEASLAELCLRGSWVGLSFDQPYVAAVVRHKSGVGVSQADDQRLQQMLQTANQSMKKHEINGAAAIVDHELLIWVPVNGPMGPAAWLRQLDAEWNDSNWQIGVSSPSEQITELWEMFDQARIAASFPNATRVVNFSDLGITGLLLNVKNSSAVKQLAAAELKELFTIQTPKNKELLKTLYVYLTKGKKKGLDQLAISLSGMKYRLKTIEAISGVDLSDPVRCNHLLMLLNALIVMGELDLQ
jgi:predicted hydrocarbon binding protein